MSQRTRTRRRERQRKQRQRWPDARSECARTRDQLDRAREQDTVTADRPAKGGRHGES